MKYVVLIIDGAAGWPLADHGARTSLQLARTPNLDAMAGEGILGMARTVPPGMEPSSACACMSVLGYDPEVYYRGRSAIEAVSMEVPVNDNQVVFRCNLVAVRDGAMWSYSSGHITTEESHELIKAVAREINNSAVSFFPGTSYRHICRIEGHPDTLEALCTPPHDIPGQPVEKYLPSGPGSSYLNELMEKSKPVLANHPVNKKRIEAGDIPATMIWLFWGSGRIPAMPPFKDAYGLKAVMTSGVDLLKGMARMMHMEVLEIPGVTDGPDNDYGAQISGALAALQDNDLVVVHIEAPDEAGHAGSIKEKVEAIEQIDSEVVSLLRRQYPGELRVLVMPDHPTPIARQTHTDEPVPFMLWGPGFEASGAHAFSEAEAHSGGVVFNHAHEIMARFTTL